MPITDPTPQQALDVIVMYATILSILLAYQAIELQRWLTEADRYITRMERYLADELSLIGESNRKERYNALADGNTLKMSFFHPGTILILVMQLIFLVLGIYVDIVWLDIPTGLTTVPWIIAIGGLVGITLVSVLRRRKALIIILEGIEALD